jgi:hypothetical protein
VGVVATRPMLISRTPTYPDRGPARRYASAAPRCARHGLEEKCPCGPSAAPAGRVGPRVSTYFSSCGRAGRDDPEKRHLSRLAAGVPAVTVRREGRGRIAQWPVVSCDFQAIGRRPWTSFSTRMTASRRRPGRVCRTSRRCPTSCATATTSRLSLSACSTAGAATSPIQATELIPAPCNSSTGGPSCGPHGDGRMARLPGESASSVLVAQRAQEADREERGEPHGDRDERGAQGDVVIALQCGHDRRRGR